MSAPRSASAIRVDAPDRHDLPRHPDPAVRELEDLAVDEHVAAGNALGGGVRGVAREVAVLAVDGDEVGGPGERDEPPLLLLLRVARDVERAQAFVGDLRAAAAQAVHELPHRDLVSGDEAGREHDEIARSDREVRVLAAGEPGERAPRLALRPGREHAQLARREAARLGQADRHPGREVEVPESLREPDVRLHRAPEQRDAPPEGARGGHDLLDAVDVRGEARHEQAAARPLEGLLEGRAHVRLGQRGAGPLGVRRVGQQEPHPLAAERLHAGEVHPRTGDRARVDL